MSSDHKVSSKNFNEILMLSYCFFVAALGFSAYTLIEDILYERRFLHHVNVLYKCL
jgi:hypothetical protein